MPILDPHALDVTSHSPDQTLRFGMRLGQLLQPLDVVCLSGELGAGKTTMAIGIGRGWGALEHVTSPTFVIINEYHRADGAELHHVDCYRLCNPADIPSSGLLERLDAGSALMIEWPEHVVAWLPEERLWIGMEYLGDEKRTLRFRPRGARFEQLLAAFRRATFGEQVV